MYDTNRERGREKGEKEKAREKGGERVKGETAVLMCVIARYEWIPKGHSLFTSLPKYMVLVYLDM